MDDATVKTIRAEFFPKAAADATDAITGALKLLPDPDPSSGWTVVRGAVWGTAYVLASGTVHRLRGKIVAADEKPETYAFSECEYKAILIAPSATFSPAQTKPLIVCGWRFQLNESDELLLEWSSTKSDKDHGPFAKALAKTICERAGRAETAEPK